ncbi:bifunctional diaminohydroxyphosphoribosylaminopyrimidine deaminase/5-amino-6-(5-phosphoribosylamino)uracil reductase RibD [Acetobacteraceae bacterium H6797]|nr:bifunctional diaminohydroxyphosphoribosylaminopyrimidine deaminase/5-amino-6-(5-phosphoribosylamino)uracil reductase RibD [Acetobacteraceae bacterium H6797]
MRAALSLARRGLGNTWPNPAVGCVIMRDGLVVGRGWTQPGGRPHAETEALRRAGEAARGATVYVTLEPCSHWGRTPPCSQALIQAGVARVVIATRDPDPRVDGRGIAQLRAAGIEVVEGMLEAEAREQIAGFASRNERGRPLTLLKLATSLDGRIATGTGESQWITGPEARRRGHELRGQYDAVMVGAGTALADDPDLTCRLPGYAPVPTVRVVADSRLRLPLTARMLGNAAEAPVWVLTRPGHPAEKLEALRAAGAEVVELPASEEGQGLDPGAMLRALAERGITRLMIEGGASLAASLLRADLVDRLAWFHAPVAIGAEGRAGLDEMGITRLASAPRFTLLSEEALGPDRLLMLQRA